MPKYSGPDDIYRDLLNEVGANWLLGMLTYAMMEQQRIEWGRHRVEITGTAPAVADTQGWYESQPRAALLRAKAEAEQALRAYGMQAVEEFNNTYREEVLRSVVITEIQKLRRWVPQLGMNILGGIISSIVFTTLLVIIAFLVFNEPSINKFAQKLRQPMEIQDGNVGRNP